jgi:hypothetical protein
MTGRVDGNKSGKLDQKRHWAIAASNTILPLTVYSSQEVCFRG